MTRTVDGSAIEHDGAAGAPAAHLAVRRLAPETGLAPALVERARLLAPEPAMPIVRPAEGLAAARVEAAAMMRLRRPGPSGPACDFLDEDERRVSVLGPHPGAARLGTPPVPAPDRWVDGLIAAALAEARSGAVDVVALDASGATEMQVARLSAALTEMLAGLSVEPRIEGAPGARRGPAAVVVA